VIGPDKKLELTLSYPASTGRNLDEILRVIDRLQLTADQTDRSEPVGFDPGAHGWCEVVEMGRWILTHLGRRDRNGGTVGVDHTVLGIEATGELHHVLV